MFLELCGLLAVLIGSGTASPLSSNIAPKDCLINGLDCNNVTTNRVAVAVSRDCHSFCQCYNGTWYKNPCLLDRYYDAENNECVYDSSVCNKSSSTQKPTTNTPTITTSKSTSPTSSPAPIPGGSCTKTGDMVADPNANHCWDYLVCNNTLQLQPASCGNDYDFFGYYFQNGVCSFNWFGFKCIKFNDIWKS